MSQDKRIQKVLDAVDNMPSMPNIVIQVTQLASDEESTAKDVVEIVKYDQAITANCLKVCNSALFATRQKIATLENAVVYLGFKNLVKIVLASSAMDVFKTDQSGYGMRQGELWRHSVATAIFSQLLCSRVKFNDEPLLFTASLLHDIGKIVLDDFIKDNSSDIMELTEQGYSEFQAEKEVIGIDHASIGGLIAKRWQFPSDLVDAIQNHHTVSENKGLQFYVRVCNLMSNIACTKHDGINVSVDSDILKHLNLSDNDIDGIIKEFPLEMKKASDLLNL
jgi:putative nucleotidyltransferase with HDIG domain